MSERSALPDYRPLFEAHLARDSRKALQLRADAQRALADELEAESRAGWEDTIAAAAEAVKALPHSTKEGKVVPSLVELSDVQMVLAVGEDTFVAFDLDAQGKTQEHVFGPAKEDGLRDCETKGHDHRARYDSVKPSVVG